jgi:hypothetical protein
MMIDRRLRALLVFTVSAAGAAAQPAAAATLEKLDLPQLVEAADTIVIARTRRAETVWREGLLMTRYTFELQETLKGASGQQEVTVVVPGGMDLERRIPIAMTVPGAPTFMPDERAVLLLERADRLAPNAFSIVGFSQGRFRIEDGRVRASTPAAAQRGTPADENLASFRQRLRNLVEGRDSGPRLRSVR